MPSSYQAFDGGKSLNPAPAASSSSSSSSGNTKATAPYVSGVLSGNASFSMSKGGSSTTTTTVSYIGRVRGLFARFLKRRVPPLTQAQVYVVCVFCFMSLLCLLTSAVSVFADDDCLTWSLPLMLIAMAVVYTFGSYLILSAPYDIMDCIDNWMEDGPSSNDVTLITWARTNMLLLSIALFTTVASTITVGQVSHCAANSTRLTIQITALSIAAGGAYIGLTIYLLLLLKSHITAADASSEGPIIVTWLRCSCCSRTTKKLVSLFPFLGLAVTSLTVTALEWEQQCDQPLHEFLICSSVNLLVYAAIGVAIFFGGKAFNSRAILASLSLNILFGLCTGIAGIVFVSSSSSSCVAGSPQLFATAVAMKVAVLSSTLFVLVFTCCCKIESCIHFDGEELVHYRDKPVLRNSEKAIAALRESYNANPHDPDTKL